MRVLGVSGSLRRESHNTMLLRAAGKLAEEHSAAFEVFDGLKAIPPYDVLKNAIDWASRPLATSPLRNKPVAVIGASTGMFGAVWAQAELRKVLATTGARVLEVELALGHAHEHLDSAGHLTDPTQEEALRDSVRVLLGELENADAAALERVI